MDTDVPDASRTYFDELEPATYRGWCFQERLLPARSLIYASDTLKYYCQTETVNIGHALCEPSTGMRLPGGVYRPQSRGRPLSVEDQAAFRQSWLAVLFTYTLRSISVPSDKLVALAGIAEQFHSLSNDQYLAGLWRKTLILDLLWKKSEAGELSPRPEKYRAPSWSWASTDGLISAEYLEGKLKSDRAAICQARILDCQVQLANEDLPFGEVTRALLKLKGFIKAATLERSSTKSASVLSMNSGQDPVKIGYVTFDADEERPEEMHVIPLLWDVAGSFVLGLVMSRVSNGQYRRVGRFDNSHDSTGVAWLVGLDEQEIVVV